MQQTRTAVTKLILDTVNNKYVMGSNKFPDNCQRYTRWQFLLMKMSLNELDAGSLYYSLL